MTDDWAQVGQRVKARRQELRMTQLALATAAGTSESTIRVLESARRVPATPALRAISQALGWTPDSIERLAAGDEPAEPEPGAAPAEVAAELQALRDQISVLSERIEELFSQRADRR